MSETDAWADAQEQGYVGQVAADPPNEAYTVDADHAATAKAEREALVGQRQEWSDASRDPEAA
jgi:hypothetical protein